MSCVFLNAFNPSFLPSAVPPHGRHSTYVCGQPNERINKRWVNGELRAQKDSLWP